MLVFQQPVRAYVGGVLLACGLGACSDAVTLTRETESGGLVTYLYKPERGGPMGSPHRREALNVMDKKCPSGYIVMKDGEVAGPVGVSTVDGDESTSRRWGIQFRCK